MNLETFIPPLLHWTHCQHLLWIGSDPLFTLLLFDWFGSKVIKGAGAILSCVCRSCTTAASRIRELLRWNKLSSPHLRARSILVRAETLSGWVDKNPIQRIKTITLQGGHNIFLNLVQQKENKSVFLAKTMMRKWEICLWLHSAYPTPSACTYKLVFHLLWDLQE